MSKKIKVIPCLLGSFLLVFTPFISVQAYEVKEENKDAVQNKINDVYYKVELYEYLAGAKTETKTPTIYGASSDSYWWPIGSDETTVVDGITYAKGTPEATTITSPFGYRKDPLGRGVRMHSGTDISGGDGDVNIIAAKDGIVVFPSSDVLNNCPSSSSLSSCGGGYGNYVIIQHSDGNYTLYGHMKEGTITVKSGDKVSQGQVIGKMGSSGNSTGAHLHFEVRNGQNSSSATVDAQKYIDANNPRSVQTTSGDFMAWLGSWEGSTKVDGDYYVVANIGDGVRTVGVGVTLENNPQRFAAYGIDIKDYPTGTKIQKTIVDQIKSEIVSEKKSYIENILAKESITINEKELEALVSQIYNIGNINGFADAYKNYGNTDEFYKNWFFRAIRKGSQFEKGLTRRRNSEWALFHTGEYVYNR